MKIGLKPYQEAYLRGLVASGACESLEEALDAVFSGAQDDAWMKPYVDEALAELEAGRTSPWSVDDLRDQLHRDHPELT